ncbi:MaoC/PaaZ C-terminal domain-containing protein [Enterococcus nangangensis]|uniref:MaoC/PaaZ C-terminal domain-containing protein n=1 Tax=Enterococcus nangangensis TaxID=2559926 RepID=UPI0010F50886|nr:MaoC/PaaZ C-terminal domain-containing protein [Enterococcus nangangensis]
MDKIKIGKNIHELQVGDSLNLTEQIEDRQLLLYLGLTNDNNPLNIQHDYAAETVYERPLVPVILLMGLITSGISKHLPGPGSRIVNFAINFMKPVYHYDTITLTFQLTKIDERKEVVTFDVEGYNQKEERILDATVMVEPPQTILNEGVDFNARSTNEFPE